MFAILTRQEGRIMVVTKRGMGCGGRGSVVARFMRVDERRCCVRRSRVVLTPRCWRQVPGKLTLLGGDGGKKADHRGEHDINRRAIAQGRPDALRFTCMLVCAFPRASMHTRPRVRRAPGLPCALCLKRANVIANLGHTVSRECEGMFVARMSQRVARMRAR